MIKVLVVDDDLIELEIVREALDSEHFICRTIVNPCDAMFTIGEFMPDLIILDLNMPEMNGFELCKQIKTNPLTSHIGVIILTAEEIESNNLIRGIHLGVLDYIHKPITPDELIVKLREQDAAMNIRKQFENLRNVTEGVKDRLEYEQPTLQLFFGKGKSWRSRLIRLLTWSEWSHVGIVDGNSVIEAAGGYGVRKVPLGMLQAKYSENEIRTLPGNIDKARKMIGKKYDTRGILGWAFRQMWEDPDSWFCSELVAYASELYADHVAHRITPEDLYRLSNPLANEI